MESSLTYKIENYKTQQKMLGIFENYHEKGTARNEKETFHTEWKRKSLKKICRVRKDVTRHRQVIKKISNPREYNGNKDIKDLNTMGKKK